MILVTYLNKYFVDPKTKTPHPITRIENALETIKVRLT
jgi:ribosome maturation protein Sdo1